LRQQAGGRQDHGQVVLHFENFFLAILPGQAYVGDTVAPKVATQPESGLADQFGAVKFS
jgi:hypothetical protein